ncbi:MAG: P-loop NTPase family protein [Planctomycetota bacterium]|jgi:hypothetical protein
MKSLNRLLIAGIIVFLSLSWLVDDLAAEQVPDINSPSEIISESNVIDANLAVFVAEDYLPAFYEGNWVVFDSLVAYDLEGTPAAYLIIFRDSNSAIKTKEDLLAFLEKTSEKCSSLLQRVNILQESTNSLEKQDIKLIKDLKARIKRTELSSYMIKEFATVVTGANEESPPIIRCYKGLPEILVKKADLEKELKAEQQEEKLKLRYILYLNPLDVRYEVVSDSDKEASASVGKKFLRQSLAEESYMVSPKEKRLVKIAIQRQKFRDRVKQKEKMLAKMNDEQRKSLEQAEEAKKAHRISQWAKFLSQYREYSQQQAEEGVQND